MAQDEAGSLRAALEKLQTEMSQLKKSYDDSIEKHSDELSSVRKRYNDEIDEIRAAQDQVSSDVYLFVFVLI